MPPRKRKIASGAVAEASPTKRSRSGAVTEESPTKRLRSGRPLTETQPEVNSRPSKRPPNLASPAKSRRHNHENDAPLLEQKEDEDEDELILSPSKTCSSRLKTPPRTRPPRLLLHSVEITTPSRGLLKTHEADPGSPTSRPRVYKRKLSKVTPIAPPSTQQPKASQTTISLQQNVITVPSTPSPKKINIRNSPSHLPRRLPDHLHSCLRGQKRAILRALQDPPDSHKDDDATNNAAFQLRELVNGTVLRGEGNSCLLLGPRGSGKTRLVDCCLKRLPHQPIIIRLSGWVQNNDRLAMREIARQLTQQTGTSFLSDEDGKDEDVNPFIDVGHAISIPSSSHLPTLISVLPTCARPTVVILDAFDRFALHARQSLLYCLLDTAQNCQVGRGNKGIAIIGVTSRVDTINLLEKRVKSRFSGRILRTATPRKYLDWTAIAKNALCAPAEDDTPEWRQMWHTAVDAFLANPKVVNAMNDTFALTGDIRMLSRIMTSPVLELGPLAPFLSASAFVSAVDVQRCRHRFPYLHTLPYPSICLLIAAMHVQTAGNDIITFEMLHECFRNQVKSSTSAPVQIEGGGIGMVRCSHDILLGAFEQMESFKIFVPVAAPSTSISKEFIKYRCAVEKEEVKKAVERMGQTNLKKWLNKAQSLVNS